MYCIHSPSFPGSSLYSICLGFKRVSTPNSSVLAKYWAETVNVKHLPVNHLLIELPLSKARKHYLFQWSCSTPIVEYLSVIWRQHHICRANFPYQKKNIYYIYLLFSTTQTHMNETAKYKVSAMVGIFLFHPKHCILINNLAYTVYRWLHTVHINIWILTLLCPC